MLRITNITLRNFGPFKDTQVLDLSSKDGVTLVYGENMRGKTTLINAIRFAFFGKVITRGEEHLALHKIGNWEAAKDGIYGFSVTMEFQHEGQAYALTRECKLRSGVTEPETDIDYVQKHFLKRGSNVLSPQECDATLARIMPEQVSRFFLFDGELLQQYEELLRTDSEMGQQIKESIERILGVPVLTSARRDMNELRKEAERKESKAAQKDQRTQELGNQNVALMDQRSHHEKEIERLRKDLKGMKNTKAASEETIKKTEKLRALLLEREALDSQIKDIDAKNEERKTRLSTMAADAWRWVLLPKLESLRATEQKRADAIRAEATEREVAAKFLAQLEKALISKKCQVCGQQIDHSRSKALKGEIAKLQASGDGATKEGDLNEAIARINTLKAISSGGDTKEAMKEILLAIDDAKIDRLKKQTRVDEIGEQTKDLDESVLRRLMSEYDKTVQEIAILERGIKEEQDKLKELDENIKRIQAELDRIGGADLAKERDRRELCARLAELFDEGVSLYRDRLRGKVEIDASDLFRKLTTEKDYASLKINENYGLTIVHNDGEEIPVRSAGAEHVVALSLMGALQRNAPLRGPIIMDSPFGRLDDGHTGRIIEALPDMASQVVLLVYESELEPQFVRNKLKGNLVREYKIARKSARHSILQKSKG